MFVTSAVASLEQQALFIDQVAKNAQVLKEHLRKISFQSYRRIMQQN